MRRRARHGAEVRLSDIGHDPEAAPLHSRTHAASSRRARSAGEAHPTSPDRRVPQGLLRMPGRPQGVPEDDGRRPDPRLLGHGRHGSGARQRPLAGRQDARARGRLLRRAMDGDRPRPRDGRPGAARGVGRGGGAGRGGAGAGRRSRDSCRLRPAERVFDGRRPRRGGDGPHHARAPGHAARRGRDLRRGGAAPGDAGLGRGRGRGRKPEGARPAAGPRLRVGEHAGLDAHRERARRPLLLRPAPGAQGAGGRGVRLHARDLQRGRPARRAGVGGSGRAASTLSSPTRPRWPPSRGRRRRRWAFPWSRRVPTATRSPRCIRPRGWSRARS